MSAKSTLSSTRYASNVPKRKITRTISGVSPIAVVIEPRACPHGTCVYCPSLNVPQSYTPESPAIMRARELNYDPYLQVKARLRAFAAMGHPTDKIELIVMGGTFLAYPIDYQYNFIKRCYDALNEKDAKNLDEAKRINETSAHRCIALCIETRPDVCGPAEIQRMLEFGATRCELGVQLPDDEIYERVKRGHTVEDVKKATRLLKEAGFKVGYHLMPGLPGSDKERDIKRFKEIFDCEDFRPDQIKIYPTQVIKGSELETLYAEGKFTPYSDDELVELLIQLKTLVPKWCRIMRVMREIPPSYLVAGTKRIDLRNVVLKEMKKRGLKCRCIRCREIGFALRHRLITPDAEALQNVKMNEIHYKASDGDEYFISIEGDNEVIFGLCRLRLNKTLRDSGCSKCSNNDGNDNNGCAIVRELHVFGPEVSISMDNSYHTQHHAMRSIQHRGFGAVLLKRAEEIARSNDYTHIKVISGVGVRNYYRNLGYFLEGYYMAKDMTKDMKT